MGLIEAILEGSSLVREVREKAAEEGREDARKQGFEQGRTSAGRWALRIVLKSRFPGLDTMPEIEMISAAEALESLIETSILSTDRSAVEHAIAAATRPN